jgi:hypothetical protein
VKVKAAPAKPMTANRGLFTMIFASAPEISPGDSVTLCYGAPEAGSIRIDPPVQELKPSERFCFQVKPERTTIYTFTATTKTGNTETAALSIKVR